MPLVRFKVLNGQSWVLVDGAILDVSEFAQRHPGGRCERGWLLCVCGGSMWCCCVAHVPLGIVEGAKTCLEGAFRNSDALTPVRGI